MNENSDPSSPLPESWQTRARRTGLILAVVAAFFLGCSFIDHEAVKAFTGLVATLVWPAVILVALLWFRPEFLKLVARVTEFDAFGLKAKLSNELRYAATEATAATGPAQPPSADQVERAAAVKDILLSAPDLVRSQVDELAEEYESIRASMPPSNARTRRMSVTFAKMRTIGLATFRLRHELAKSPSPGRRLQAIASLQVQTDYEMLDWLAERLSSEAPFVQYHALLALTVAAKHPEAAGYRDSLRSAVALAKTHASKGLVGDAADRLALLREFEERVQALG